MESVSLPDAPCVFAPVSVCVSLHIHVQWRVFMGAHPLCVPWNECVPPHPQKMMPVCVVWLCFCCVHACVWWSTVRGVRVVCDDDDDDEDELRMAHSLCRTMSW